MKPKTTIFGIDTQEAYRKVMAEPEEEKKPERTNPLSIKANINAKDYIRIPGSNTVISRNELHKGLNWENTHYALADNGLFMPPPSLFMPFYINVRDASQGKITLYTADNAPIPRDEAEDLWKYLSSGHRNGCWTWLDAKFQNTSQKGMIEFSHNVEGDKSNRKLVGCSEFLEDCIEEACFVDLEFNSQGLPVKKSQAQKYSQGENIYYYHPRDGRVARFVADSVRALLDCIRNPAYSISSLGVFACAEGAPKK